MTPGEQAARLEAEVLLPLASGGRVRTGRPFGRRGAALLAQGAPWSTPGAGELARWRLAAARALAPIDSLAPVSPAEWALGAVLHDLLLACDPELGEARAARLLRLAEPTLAAITAPQDARQALERFATFGGLAGLVRHDRHVAWWSGAQSFHGVPVPQRFTTWASLRRVEVRTSTAELGTLAVTPERRASVLRVLAGWLAHDPLLSLELAASGRVLGERERWTALLASDAGCRLAGRLLRRHPAEARERFRPLCAGRGAPFDALLATL